MSNNTKILNAVLRYIYEKNKLHANKIHEFLVKCNDHHSMLAEYYFERLMYSSKYGSQTPKHLAKCYMMLIDHMFNEQIKFRRTGKYSCLSEAQAHEAVYSNGQYMESYMLGLAVSQFLLENHWRIFEFYRKRISDAEKGDYLEIGPGHGMFLLESIMSKRFKEFTVVDISEASIDLCKSIVEFDNDNMSNQIDYKEIDIFTFRSNQRFSNITIGEVIEHIEKPMEIMKRIYEWLNKEGQVFVSTCANAPAVDHIYNFGNVIEIRKILSSPGFEISDELILPYENITLETASQQNRSINYCAILKK